MPKRTSFLALTTVVGILLTGAFEPTATARGGDGSRNPLEGWRSRTMRTFARYLDEAAQATLERATKEAQGSKSPQARFLPSLRSFGRRADSLHRMIEAGRASGFEIGALVDDLTRQAHEIDARMRSAQVLGSVYQDWDAVLDLLGRMTQLLDGRDASLPHHGDTRGQSAIGVYGGPDRFPHATPAGSSSSAPLSISSRP